MTERRRLQSPLLVGRDNLLALAERRIAEARGGQSGLLMFAGEAGIGKSRLARAAIQKALDAGFRYAKSDLAPQDRLVPLASIADLARAMENPTWGSLGQKLLEMRGGKGGDSLASRRILVREIAEHIIDAITTPTVLVFEDLQWSDELSLEVVGDLARLGRERPLLVLATYRLDELPVGSIHREWRSRLLTQRLAEEARLERLGYDDTALIASLILGTGLPVPREVANAVFARTNGIPLHVEELIAALGDDVRSDGRSIRDASVPDTIEDAVLARMYRLSDGAREVARAGAVIGRCFAPDVLAGILNRPVADLDAPLQELVDSSILYPFDFVDRGYYDFRHQLLRDTLYETVPAPELRQLHARAGEFGAQLIGSSEIHASFHFERAGLRAEAFEAALAGARSAAAISSRYESFELYRRAVANIPDDLPPADMGRVYDEYADAGAAVDDIRAIVEAAKLARRCWEAAADLLGIGRTTLILAAVARRDVRPRSEREQLIRQAESEILAAPASASRAAALGDLWIHQALLDFDAGRFDDGRATLADARRLLIEGGEDDRDIDYFLAIPEVLEGRVEAGLATMLDVARNARDSKLESTGVSAYRSAAAIAVRVMDYRTAQAGLGEGLRYADEVEQSYCRHVMAAASAQVAWAEGRWDEAIQIGELEMVEKGSRRGTMGSRDALAFVALGRGLVDRARSLLDASLGISRPANEGELILPGIWGLAETALIAGEPERALAHCDEALELAIRTRERALLIPFVVTGVRAAIADRRPEAAERWLERATGGLAGWEDRAAAALAHADGLIRLAAGSLVAARASLEAAVAGWDARGRIWEATWARLDLAASLLRASRYVEVNRLLTDIKATAARLGSVPLQARAEDIERQAKGRGADEEAWYPLTIREFEVARQIAAGMTNAEIAVALFVSPKTVSAHVEHMLAKLGASRRAEIAAWVTTIAQPVA